MNNAHVGKDRCQSTRLKDEKTDNKDNWDKKLRWDKGAKIKSGIIWVIKTKGVVSHFLDVLSCSSFNLKE